MLPKNFFFKEFLVLYFVECIILYWIPRFVIHSFWWLITILSWNLFLFVCVFKILLMNFIKIFVHCFSKRNSIIFHMDAHKWDLFSTIVLNVGLLLMVLFLDSSRDSLVVCWIKYYIFRYLSKIICGQCWLF